MVTSVWKAFGELKRLAAAGETLLAVRVREADDWKRAGYPTAAEWMAATIGGGVGVEIESRSRDIANG